MPEGDEMRANHFDLLSQEIAGLKGEIAELGQRVTVLETTSIQQKVGSRPEKMKTGRPKNAPVDLPEEIGWTKISQEVLLPRVAAVCFMLVFALILRTITDNGMIDRQVGSYLGTIYAVGLIGWGWYLYRTENRLAPVFPSCGVLLLYSIIYETHVHFESITSTMVYTILLAAELAVVIIGLRCRALVLLYLATFGSTFVGIAIGFPTPLFAFLGVVLILNNIAAHLASRKGITSTLRWYTLFFTMIFWLLWTSKLNYALRFGSEANDIGLYWILPVLFVFYLFHLYSSLIQMKIAGTRLDCFHFVLPSVTAVGLFFVVFFVVPPWLGHKAIVGQGAVALSALYIALVAWLAKQEKYDVRDGMGFVVAGTLLLILGLAFSVPAILALPVWVVAAVTLTVYSKKWQSGGVRVISYLFQLFIVVFAYKSGAYEVGHVPWAPGFLVAAVLAGSCLWLYSWCRKNRPDYDSLFFKEFDSQDNTAILLLMIGLIHSYITAIFAVSASLHLFLEDPANAFYCSKSIIINLGAVSLMAMGLHSKVREILRLSVFVVAIGGFKVFIFDMFKAQGMPLVLSVFSLGIVAVAGSMTLKKWQHYQLAGKDKG